MQLCVARTVHILCVARAESSAGEPPRWSAGRAAACRPAGTDWPSPMPTLLQACNLPHVCPAHVLRPGLQVPPHEEARFQAALAQLDGSFSFKELQVGREGEQVLEQWLLPLCSVSRGLVHDSSCMSLLRFYCSWTMAPPASRRSCRWLAGGRGLALRYRMPAGVVPQPHACSCDVVAEACVLLGLRYALAVHMGSIAPGRTR